ncbi:hypothetical protein M2298_002031 [Brevibacillus sp. 1238]|nr:hypothetical protein [Brevibacillus sp. 1238]
MKYAISNGWEYYREKQVMEVENGDFLIHELGLTV